MTHIDLEDLKAYRWEDSAGRAGVGIYSPDENGRPANPVVVVEMTTDEMVELAHDLLRTAGHLDLGLTYLERVTREPDLTPADEEAILDLLRKRTTALTCDECGDETITLQTREWLQDNLLVCDDCAKWIDAEHSKIEDGDA